MAMRLNCMQDHFPYTRFMKGLGEVLIGLGSWLDLAAKQGLPLINFYR